MGETGRSPPRRHAADNLPTAEIWNGDDAPGSTPVAEITDMLSAQELAAKFGRSTRTMRRWAQCGGLVPIRIGGGMFYPAEDVRVLISDRMAALILQRKLPISIFERNNTAAGGNPL